MFPTETAGTIAAELGRTRAAIGRRAALLGLKKSNGRYERIQDHYSVNSRAFHELTPATAYVLGLILADGSLRGSLLKITNNDLNVMLAVRKSLGSDHRLVVPTALRDRTFTCSIRSAELTAGLRKWGIIENKSLIGIWPPDLSAELFPHVLRGYFDGDGYVGYGYRHGLRVKFTCGSPGLLRALSLELHERYGLPIRTIEQDKGRPNANRLWYYGPAGAQVGQIMYSADGLHIKRKRSVFDEYATRRD